MVSSIIERLKSRKQKLRELSEDESVRTKLANMKKNANERELEKYYEEERQKQIKRELDIFRKKRQDEFWHGRNILNERNIFKDKFPEILKQKTIFKVKNNLACPSIYLK